MKNFLTCLILMCLALPVQAEDHDETKEVTLSVRTIKASNAGAATKISVDKRLNDLESKLEDLPYKEYVLRSSQQVVIPIKHKQSVHLPEGQNLDMRLLYLKKNGLGLWLNWNDKAGMNLLNSRIHLNCREPVIAGTDAPDGGAYLLAVEVKNP